MSLETAAYRRKIALHILPHSPALARHYASRLTEADALTPISCSACANVFIHGQGAVRVVRRALVKTCYTCGQKTHMPLPPNLTKTTFPSVRAQMKKKTGQGEAEVEVEIITKTVTTPPALAAVPPVPPTQRPPAAKRSKSKGGLQTMLQRNHERELRESQKGSAGISLASFLQGL